MSHALVALALALAGTADRAGLVFTRYTAPDHAAVWVADADGSHARRLVADGYAGSLSADGRWVAYSVSSKGRALPVLDVRRVAGGRPRRLGRVSGVWAPGGARLAVSERHALFLVDARTSTRRWLVSADAGGISFAPGGTRLAFAGTNGKAGRECRSDVFVVRLSDLRVTKLTHDGHSDEPVWGGGWLVYRSFHFNGDWSIGRLRLMRPDGSGKRAFARGDERTYRAQMGLDPLELSRDGKHLLACAAAEFGCPPVTFSVPGGRRYDLGRELERTVARRSELATAADLSRDGRAALVYVGPFDTDDGDRVYAIPFRGGKPRLLVRDAATPRWAR